MTVGIVGLGLIGGSAARAYHTAGHTVYGADLDSSLADFAVLDGTSNGILDDEKIASCDLILLCTYPEGVISYLSEKGHLIGGHTLVMDFAGVKGSICPRAFALAEEYGFTFVGGHPMAGSHKSGYRASRANLFTGAGMIIVPPRFDDPHLFERVKELLSPLGFARHTFCTAEKHDRMIAYTSQLAHVLSNAYARSESIDSHRGFSAGSWRDLTRVAHLDAQMWCTLFFENREPLLSELDGIINRLCEYRDALREDDADRLISILREGTEMKDRADRTK